MLDEKEELNQELQKKQKTLTKVMREKNEIEKENEELKKRIRRLTSSIQVEVIFKKCLILVKFLHSIGWFWGERVSTFDRH